MFAAQPHARHTLLRPQLWHRRLSCLRSFNDFARLVFAPHVVVGSAGSSWAIWSALAANSGEVWYGTDKLMQANAFKHTPNVRVSRAPGLYPDTMRNHSIPSMIAWLQSN